VRVNVVVFAVYIGRFLLATNDSYEFCYYICAINDVLQKSFVLVFNNDIGHKGIRREITRKNT